MNREKLAAVGLLGFSLLYLGGALGLKVGSLAKPGPGLIPLAVGLGLVFFSGLNFWRAFRQAGPPASREGGNARAVAVIMAATLVYPFLLNYLGFILATTAVVYVMLAILGFRNPLRGLLLALALTVFCFIVFAVYLGVALPGGPLEDLLYLVRV